MKGSRNSFLWFLLLGLILSNQALKAEDGPGIENSVVRVIEAGSSVLERSRGLLLADGAPFSGWIVRSYEAGSLRSREVYIDGKRDGKMQRWYPNGQLESSRDYQENRKHGIHEGWFPDGQLKFQMSFTRGIYCGERKEWFKSGKPFAVFHYVDGKEEGLQRVWDESGKLRSNYVVKNGRRYGLVGAKPCVSVPGLPISSLEIQKENRVVVK